MQQLQNTLYVTTPNSYAHLDHDTIVIEVDREKKLQVPLHHVGSLVCFGNVMLSPALMHRCADDGIALVLLDDNGRFKARLEGPLTGNVLLRQAQHRQMSDAAFTMHTARAIVAGKIRNSRQILLRGARESDNDADREQLSRSSEALASALRGAARAPDLDTLRGLEGSAAKVYFSALNSLLRADLRESFCIDGRSRRPPRDRLNCLMSFLYSMLMNDCRSACEIVGLDTQIGSLHAIRPGRAALALDLMEEFRAFVADRLALTLVNRGQICASDCESRDGGAVLLKSEARRSVIVAYQERKKDEVTHPLLNRKVPIGFLPVLQARFLARTIRGELPGYLPFLIR
jgi:CRISP-associated protein Cas1